MNTLDPNRLLPAEGHLPPNIAKLPKAIHMEDLDTSDRLAHTALGNGWEVRRRSANYFVAVRKGQGYVEGSGHGERFEQVSVWVRGGVVIASRSTVIEETEQACVIASWLESEASS